MSRYTVDVPSVQVLTIRTSCQSATYQQSDDNVGVVGLNLAFSSDYHEATPKRLIKTFDCCGHYFIRCNPCFKSDLISCQGGPLVCHRYRVIYTDGSCLDNGTANAAAGVGIAFGTKVEARSWMLVGDDPTGQRNNHTNQRAELLAAIHGIQSIATWTSTNRPCPDRKSHAEKKTMVWVIATDSEYVVKGMTKWLPMWKNNNMRASNGRRPDNLDLFLRLEGVINEKKQQKGVTICFWRIPREYNSIADALAEKGAKKLQEVRILQENSTMV